ncbi:MAG TPA: metalloregulator ArsR/SmtB family transcription factor [Acidobacteriaceae bacterium]|nr:metalloregulator ArsR/SmtB family transcription factor [Acidobacteriaceae bacterium]
MSKAASLIADPSRSAILWSLLGGESRPASELAMIANISPQTASNHLRLLLNAGFVKAEAVGRNRFYKLCTPFIGVALESLAATIGGEANGIAQKSAPELVFARTCYDHLAGELGVMFLNQFCERQLIVEYGGDYQLSTTGEKYLCELGIDRHEAFRKRRRFAYPCLDWSQRVPHLGGALGAALLEWLFQSKVIARRNGSRAVRVTDPGREMMKDIFGIELNRMGTAVL